MAYPHYLHSPYSKIISAYLNSFSDLSTDDSNEVSFICSHLLMIPLRQVHAVESIMEILNKQCEISELKIVDLCL